VPSPASPPTTGNEPAPTLDQGLSAEVVARAPGASGELVLRRRGSVLELIVDGVFTMDTAHTETEAALATLALDALTPRSPTPDRPAAGPPPRIMVGGLGLGYTLAALLADPRVPADATVEVVELETTLVGWVRAGLVPAARTLLDDPRVRVKVADLRDAVPRLTPGTLDALLLDVDNGPGFLVHAANEAVYATGFLTTALATLRPGGVLAVWSADPSPELLARMRTAAGECTQVLLPVHRDGRRFDYAVYLSHSGDRDPRTGG